jgi:hypothetical protein
MDGLSTPYLLSHRLRIDGLCNTTTNLHNTISL